MHLRHILTADDFLILAEWAIEFHGLLRDFHRVREGRKLRCTHVMVVGCESLHSLEQLRYKVRLWSF